ncbi:MAG: phosphoribosylformylglycinamidine synthase subunit PurQ [Nitrospinota bacterium]|nr:phosphoribosylformylglycinamidine synthase subunit PurQ [Nitrospinota bacterium]
MKCGVVVFPGSNCDRDCYHILKQVYKLDVGWIWHKDLKIGNYDFIVLPGGFSYGDYLRPGAIARFSMIMKSVLAYANAGGRILGICNGFQILLEAGLLPGALMRNRSQTFVCKSVYVRVENHRTPFTNQCKEKAVLKIPVAHADGCYFAPADDLKRLEDNSQIVLRYCNRDGETNDAANPNGSVDQVAAITNDTQTILGMMPHPERCADPLWSDLDGQAIFKSLLQTC